MGIGSDERLFLLWRERGDPRALTRLFDRVAPQLLALGRYLVREGHQAEDLLQATFLQAIEDAADFDPKRPLYPWLVGILTHRARYWNRREARSPHPERMERPGPPDPAEVARGREFQAAVRSALADLPAHYRSVLEPYVGEGKAPREIAVELGLAAGTVRVQVHRGLELLRKALPTGFALGAAGVAFPTRGLAAVRADVLRQAGKIAPQAAGGAATSLLPLGVLLVSTKSLAILLSSVLLLAVGWSGRSWILPETIQAPPLVAAAADVPGEGSVIEVSPSIATPLGPDRVGVEEQADVVHDTEALLTGRFVHSDGSPVAGVKIELRGKPDKELAGAAPSSKNWETLIAKSGYSGRFELKFDPLANTSFSLLGMLEDHVYAHEDLGQIEQGEVRELPDIRLLRSARITGFVRDSEGKAQKSGWKIRFHGQLSDSSSGSFLGSTHLGSEGRFTVSRLAPGTYDLIAYSPSGDGASVPSIELAEGQQLEVDIPYDGPGIENRLLVEVESRARLQGLGDFVAPDLEVAAESIRLRGATGVDFTARALGDDRYSFDDLGPGPYTLIVDDPRFELWQREELVPGHVQRVTLAGGAAISLTITDAASGTRMNDCRVDARYGQSAIQGILPSHLRSPTVDGISRGILALDLTLLVNAPGYATLELPVPGLLRGETRQLEAVMTRGAEVRGRILTADGSAPGQAIPLELRKPGETQKSGQTPDASLVVSSTASGEFLLQHVPAGAWVLTAGTSPLLTLERRLSVGAEDLELELRLPRTAQLRVWLKTPEGASLNGVALSLTRGGPEAPTADRGRKEPELILEPDAQGLFLAEHLPCEPLRLELALLGSRYRGRISRGAFAGGDRLPLAYIHPSPDELIEREFDLSQSFPGSLEVLIEVNGKATKGLEVEIRPLNVDSWRKMSASSDHEGRCTLGPLRPGRHQLSISRMSLGLTWAYSLPELVHIQSGEGSDLRILIETRKGALSVLDEDGQPMGNASVRWLSSGRPPTIGQSTDEKGVLNLELPMGSYEFTLNSRSAERVLVEWGPDGPEPAEIRLPHWK